MNGLCVIAIPSIASSSNSWRAPSKGEVQVFELIGHPKAKRCYAWSEASQGNRRRFFAAPERSRARPDRIAAAHGGSRVHYSSISPLIIRLRLL